MFTEAIERILVDHCTAAVVRSIENGASATTLWNRFSEAGFLELMAPEASGGAGLTLAALFPILTALGRHAAPVPAAQSIAARSLLRTCAISVPAGILTLSGCARRESNGSVVAPLTSFGMVSDFALVNVEGEALLLDAALATRTPCGVRASLCASLHWRREAVSAPIAINGEEIRTFNAAIHSAAMAGAMERLFTMTLAYCNERMQFGKAIGKFQAVQHQLSVMAEQVAAAGIAAEIAFSGGAPVPAFLPAAVAKARASMAAPVVAAAAHALHGAIGVTEEFDLQLFSRRLHEWRVIEGSESYWNRLIGEAILGQAQTSVMDFTRATVSHSPVTEQPYEQLSEV